MAKKHSSLGLAALVAAGAGAAALAAKNRQEKTVEKAEVKKATSDYVDSVLKSTEEQVAKSLAELRSKRQAIKAAKIS